MIEEEIKEIISDQTDEGYRLNRITDEFRRGRDTNDLLILLNSENARVLSIAAWILSEIPFHLYNTEIILSRLRTLTDHMDSPVRFQALSALYPALRADDPETHALLQKLQRDPNNGVRMAAEAAATQLSLR